MARVWVGTSGFSYKEWKRDFYPADLPDREMLRYYSSQFRAVEIDSSFYRMPTEKTLETWRANTPEEFRFSLKASRQITHFQRLQVPSDALKHLTSVMPVLGTRLSAVLYQLPPFFKCDVDRLRGFLEVLPDEIKAAFEFRHPSWFVPEVYDVLERHDAALCIHDTDDGCSPQVLTARSTYVRLRRTSYSREQQDEWRARWNEWAGSGIEVFAYIKHKDNPDAPRIALEFAQGF